MGAAHLETTDFGVALVKEVSIYSLDCYKGQEIEHAGSLITESEGTLAHYQRNVYLWNHTNDSLYE